MSRWLGTMAICLFAAGSTTLAQSQSAPRYAVGDLALGSRIQSDSSDYREYKCSPSEQFAEFTWCQKTRQERDRRQSFNVTYSILHSGDGTVLYVSRFQEPVFFGPNEANQAIRRNSVRLGIQAKIERLPRRRGLPEGVLATWGKVTLESLDSESIKTLAEGRSPKKGYLIDFIGNFTRSAKEGLPIYRISGGPGFLWVASYDERGRGTLRYAAIDPSAIHPTTLSNEAGSSDPQSAGVNGEPIAAAMANQNAAVDRQGAEFALREAKEATEKARADAEVARHGLEAASRDAQLAKAEAERLSAETTKLNAAVQQLGTEKAAAESKAYTMESVAYGLLAVLIAFLVSPLILSHRKGTIADRKKAEIEPSQILSVPLSSHQAGANDSVSHSQDGAASSLLAVAQASKSAGIITMNQTETASDHQVNALSERPEGNVTTPSEKAHEQANS